MIRTRKQPETGGTLGVACDASGQAALVLAWFGLRAEDRGTAAVVLHGLRYPAARIVAARCRCGIAVAEDHVADAVFVMLYRIRRVPRLRIPATTTLAYLCGVARNEWRWDRWRRARESEAAVELAAAAPSQHAARAGPLRRGGARQDPRVLLRPGEAIGLRRSDVDLRKGSLTVRRSRTMGEDNAPKTKRSKRTISLRPHVVLALRAMPSPLHPREDAFFFTTQHGNPIDQERFVDKHWRRVFAATGVRPRKFYATRHTFISIALTKGENLKWLATYCGTSIEMIERHYSKWLGNNDDQLALLVRRGAERARRGPQGGPL